MNSYSKRIPRERWLMELTTRKAGIGMENESVQPTRPESKRAHIYPSLIENVLHRVHCSRQSCRINVLNGDRHFGSFFLREGRIVDACCGTISGADAALHIMGWGDVHLECKAHSFPAGYQPRIRYPINLRINGDAQGLKDDGKIGGRTSCSIYCPHCRQKQQVVIEKFKAPKHLMRFLCSCGRNFRVGLNYRRFPRKEVSIIAEYMAKEHPKQVWREEESKRCLMVNLSLAGCRLNLAKGHGLRLGNQLLINFAVNDNFPIESTFQAIAVHSEPERVGCRFLDSELARLNKAIAPFLAKSCNN